MCDSKSLKERERETERERKHRNRRIGQVINPIVPISETHNLNSLTPKQRSRDLEGKDESYRSEFLFVTRRSWEFLIRSILLDYTQRRFGKRFLGFRETKKEKKKKGRKKKGKKREVFISISIYLSDFRWWWIWLNPISRNSEKKGGLKRKGRIQGNF